MNRKLLDRLHDREDNLTERKLEGAGSSEFRKAIVAFANSVPETESAVLFIGMADRGEIVGVTNPDSLQKTIRAICEKDCYPPVTKWSSNVIEKNGKKVLAVEVLPSDRRPHFSGPAYVRRGSETCVASDECFDELVASRLEKPREILKWKGKVITVVTRGKDLGSTKCLVPTYRTTHQCEIVNCGPHWVELVDISTNGRATESLESVQLSLDDQKNTLMLIVDLPR